MASWCRSNGRRRSESTGARPGLFVGTEWKPPAGDPLSVVLRNPAGHEQVSVSPAETPVMIGKTEARANQLLEALYPDITYNAAQTRMVFNALVRGPLSLEVTWEAS